MIGNERFKWENVNSLGILLTSDFQVSDLDTNRLILWNSCSGLVVLRWSLRFCMFIALDCWWYCCLQTKYWAFLSKWRNTSFSMVNICCFIGRTLMKLDIGEEKLDAASTLHVPSGWKLSAGLHTSGCRPLHDYTSMQENEHLSRNWNFVLYTYKNYL